MVIVSSPRSNRINSVIVTDRLRLYKILICRWAPKLPVAVNLGDSERKSKWMEIIDFTLDLLAINQSLGNLLLI